MSGYEASDMQPVLRCGQCNKPFDKQSTLKRHLYYCWSRKTGNVTRPRSCIPCAKGKTACDKRRPQCSRCIAKSLECHYPGNAQRFIGVKMKRVGDAASEPGALALVPSSSAEFPCVDSNQEANNGSNVNLHDTIDITVPDYSNLEDGYVEWDNTNIGFTDFFPPSSSSSLASRLTPPAHQSARGQQSLQSYEMSIPDTPTSAVRSLVQRPKLQAGTQRISHLIFHTLKSYPLMMLHHNTLPLFIHPITVSSKDEDSHMRPLTNCMSLMHMLSGGVPGSRKLFWKNVQLECERMSYEHEKLHKWELLAAMQALSIYILVRLDEGETDYNNFDALLVKTFIVAAQKMGRINLTCQRRCGLCNSDLQFSWREWIFRESRRRLAILYRVMNMLIHFEPTAMCDMPTEFILAPLPAKKQLWEAGDEFSWKAESQRKPGIQVSFGLATDGELIELDESRLSCSDSWLSSQSTSPKAPSRSTANWEEWCAGMDGFGGLVMLAASLVV
ncbi:hypothetical protein F4679DRAFT_561112 [Xylaria curta]|nr:hypothetical protein F4679DRAFT_561112 [Xylaria curta]